MLSTNSQELPTKPYGWSQISHVSYLILLFVFSYAILRYNVIKGVTFEHFPLYIANKAFALSSVIFIGISYLLGNLARFYPSFFAPKVHLRKYFGLLGFGLASIHALLSLIILRPLYYAKFFRHETLNLVGELTLLFGVLALFIFSIVAITSIPSVMQSMEPARWKSAQRKGYFALILVMAHVITMGLEGWLVPGEWPGNLLPISLIAFIFIAFVLLVKLATLFTKSKKDRISHF